jgi:two-component system CheB/CheR fusion protein
LYIIIFVQDNGVDFTIFVFCHSMKKTKEKIDLNTTGDRTDGLNTSRSPTFDAQDEMESAKYNTTHHHQLAEAHKYSMGILESIKEAVLILDEEFRIVSVNKSFLDKFKVSKQDTFDRYVYDIGNRQWDIPQLRLLLDAIVSDNQPFGGFRVEHDFPSIGRKIMHLEAHRVIQKSDIKNILLIIEDITGITERESLFRNMANHAPVMIWTAATNARFDFFNNMWLEYTGKTREELLKMTWLEDLLPPDREMFMDSFRRAFNNRYSFVAEVQIRHNSGTHRWVVFNGKPAFDDQQKFTGYVGTALDIHEQKMVSEEMERRVEQRTRELHESNTDLRQFAYLASHELQEPLRKIRTFISMQEKTDHLPDIRLFNEKINNSAGRMSALVKDILTFSKLAGKNEPPSPVNLEDIFESVKFDFELLLLEKKASFTYGKLPEISGISWQIRQLFSNLLSNSLKFSSKVPEITVSSSPMVALSSDLDKGLKPGRAYHNITFSDNGIGFEQHHEHQIFSIFKRLHSTDEYSGTGIGLALCKKIVENHDGSIRVKSELGKGTVFTIYLPV